MADNAGVSSVTVPTTVLRGTETVLLVEDENSLRALTRNLLETGGYTVIEASDATQAAEIARRHDGPIQLLLTDVILPGVNGRGLSEGLAPKRPEMRVLFMSGYTDATISSRGILDSGTFLLHKPFTRGALLNKVREVLDAPRAKPANASGN